MHATRTLTRRPARAAKEAATGPPGRPRESRRLSAHAGRWSVEHWKTATALWVLLVAVAVTTGALVGARMLTNAQMSTGETARAEQMLADAGFDTPASEAVIVRSETRRKSPDARASVAEVYSSGSASSAAARAFDSSSTANDDVTQTRRLSQLHARAGQVLFSFWKRSSATIPSCRS